MTWPTEFPFNTENITLLVFGGTLLFTILFHLIFFLRLALHKPQIQGSDMPVSVIIPARNEAKNLMNNLPYVMKQDHPEFQVVVVNDASWDSSKEVLETMEKQYPNLHVVNIEETEHYTGSKKFAVTLGIKGAKYEHLIFTDADCVPSSTSWLRGMAGKFNGKRIVIGYGPLAKRKGLLNYIIRYDTFQIAMQYLSFALAKAPYMGVGRNLGYTKDLFFSVSGFKKHYHIASGDDDLFINQVARKHNVAVQVHKDAQTISAAPETWRGWFAQKRRHFTTAGRYRFGHKILLSILPMLNMTFFTTAAMLLIWQTWWLPVVCAIGLRWLIQLLIFNGAMNKLGGKDLLVGFLFLDIIFLILNPLIYLSNTLVKPKGWQRKS